MVFNLFLFFPHSQLLFVVGFTLFLANCVDYDILFANKFVNHTDSSKVTLPDAFIPMDVCSNRWVWCNVVCVVTKKLLHVHSFPTYLKPDSSIKESNVIYLH